MTLFQQEFLNSTSVVLKWKKASDDFTGYEIAFYLQDTSKNDTVIINNTNIESTTIPNLTPGGKYRFAIFTLSHDDARSEPEEVELRLSMLYWLYQSSIYLLKSCTVYM